MKYLDNYGNEFDDIFGVVRSNVIHAVPDPIKNRIRSMRGHSNETRRFSNPVERKYDIINIENDITATSQKIYVLEMDPSSHKLVLIETNSCSQSSDGLKIAETQVPDGVEITAENIRQYLSAIGNPVELEDADVVISRWRGELESITSLQHINSKNIDEILNSAGNICGDVMSRQLGNSDPNALEKYSSYFRDLLKKAFAKR